MEISAANLLTLDIIKRTLSNGESYSAGVIAGIDMVLEMCKIELRIKVTGYPDGREVPLIKLIRRPCPDNSVAILSLGEAKAASENLPYTFPKLSSENQKYVQDELRNMGANWELV